MVNEEKVKIMTKLAVYESKEGKEQLPYNNFYKSDYVRFNILKTIISSTIGFFIIVGIYILLNAEMLLKEINNIDYVSLAYKFIFAYFVFVVVYSILAGILYSFRYERVKPGIISYNKELKSLKEFYNKQESSSDKPKKIKERGEIKVNDEFIDY